MKGYTNVINRVFTKVVYLLRKQHVVGNAKEQHTKQIIRQNDK
jgi:hypothetical protein